MNIQAAGNRYQLTADNGSLLFEGMKLYEMACIHLLLEAKYQPCGNGTRSRKRKGKLLRNGSRRKRKGRKRAQKLKPWTCKKLT